MSAMSRLIVPRCTPLSHEECASTIEIRAASDVALRSLRAEGDERDMLSAARSSAEAPSIRRARVANIFQYACLRMKCGMAGYRASEPSAWRVWRYIMRDGNANARYG